MLCSDCNDTSIDCENCGTFCFAIECNTYSEMREFISKIKNGEFDSFGDVAWAANRIEF